MTIESDFKIPTTFQTHTFVETNLTATSKGNTVSMVTVSSCIGKKRDGKKWEGGSYVQVQTWLLMLKVISVVTFNDHFNQVLPSTECTFKIFKNK